VCIYRRLLIDSHEDYIIIYVLNNEGFVVVTLKGQRVQTFEHNLKESKFYSGRN